MPNIILASASGMIFKFLKGALKIPKRRPLRFPPSHKKGFAQKIKVNDGKTSDLGALVDQGVATMTIAIETIANQGRSVSYARDALAAELERSRLESSLDDGDFSKEILIKIKDGKVIESSIYEKNKPSMRTLTDPTTHTNAQGERYFTFPAVPDSHKYRGYRFAPPSSVEPPKSRPSKSNRKAEQVIRRTGRDFDDRGRSVDRINDQDTGIRGGFGDPDSHRRFGNIA